MPVRQTLIPIFTKQVQLDILVQKDNRKEILLATYLGFGILEDDIQEKGDVFLHVHIQSSLPHKGQNTKCVQEILQDFNS